MNQSRRIIEQLLTQNSLPIKHADAAARHLEVYPSTRSWLDFFDRALLIIGAVAVVLSLVFFIAYNWLYMGKLAKFALVEGALVITIAAYVALSFRRRFKFIRQLLLLIASIITGSLLALFGQVYQTGADTWQLFFGWLVLISPWVFIARFPALWLLWLGLINTSILIYINSSRFSSLYYQDFWQFAFVTLINFIAFYAWLRCFENKRSSGLTDVHLSDVNITGTRTATAPTTDSKSSLHFSTYVVALLSTYDITYLTISTLFDHTNFLLFLVAITLWLGWCAFIYQRFRRRQIDLLMLTYLCVSIIAIITSILIRGLFNNINAGGFLLIGLLLIGMSSCAVYWLREVSKLTKSKENDTLLVSEGDKLVR